MTNPAYVRTYTYVPTYVLSLRSCPGIGAIWGPLPGHWFRYASTMNGEEKWNQGLLCVLCVLCVRET